MSNETKLDDGVSSYWEFKGKEQFIDDWFLMSSPVPIAIITCSYLLFVLKLGPELMKNRTPYKLKSVLLMYNAIQVLASCLLFQYGASLLTPQGLFKSTCSFEKNDLKKIALGMYLYMLAKVSELLDTVFFVLRKKYKQVTFLHVYHHTLMVIGTWVTLKYEPSFTVIFLGTLNSFVHIVMYAYYGLSAIPSLAKFLWWKKYITKMQLIQFLAVLVQAIVNFSLSGCPPSYVLISFIVINSLVFFYLFSDFYIKAYLKNKKSKIVKDGPKEESFKDKSEYFNSYNDDMLKDKPKRRNKTKFHNGGINNHTS